MSSRGRSGEAGLGGRFIASDPLRGAAAFVVVATHCAALAGLAFAFRGLPWTVFHNAPLLIIESGTFAVWIFFTLSAYLLGRPFIAAYVAGRPLPDVGAYLYNRAARVLPAMIAVVAVTLLVVGRLDSSWGSLVAIPLFGQVYFPGPLAHGVASQLWTLDVEVPFYVLLPLVAWAGMRATPPSWSPTVRRRALLVGVAVIGVGSLSLLRLVSVSDVDRQKWFPMMACSFTPGLALAVLETAVPDWLRDPVRGRRAALGLLLAALLVIVYYVASLPHPNLVLRTLAASVGSGLIVGAALVRQWSNGDCWRVLDNRPLHWLGKRAYSLYLFHLLVLAKLIVPLYRHPGPLAWVVYLAAGMAVLIPLTAVSYRLLERPFLLRRRAWRSPTETAPAAPVAHPAIPAVLPAEP